MGSTIGFNSNLEKDDKVKTDTTETYTHDIKLFGFIPLFSSKKKHIVDSQQIGKV
jgi:hypothetical protein